MKEIRRATRVLLHRPGFSLVIILTLTLGIGANSAVFSVVNGVLLKSLPYPDAGRIVTLWHRGPGIGIDVFEQSLATYLLYQTDAHSLASIAMHNNSVVTVTGLGDPSRVPVSRASGSLFEVLQVRPRIGRVWEQSAEVPNGPKQVIISNDFWEQHFGGNEKILGRPIEIDGAPWEIIGVMPPGFHYPQSDTQVWLPYPIDISEVHQVSFNFNATGRLAPGATLKSLDAELNRALNDLPDRYPGAVTRTMMDQVQISAFAQPLRETVVGEVRESLVILTAMVAFVLLIACANVINLILVRTEGMRREIALRTALGASRLHLVRQGLTESLILSILGAAGGLGLAFAGTRLLKSLAGGMIPRIDEIGIDPTVVFVTLLISVAVAALFAVLPQLGRSHDTLLSSLNEAARGGSTSRKTARIRGFLVASEIALAMILLVGSGLMAKSFWQLRHIDTGFRSSGVLTFNVTLPEKQYTTDLASTLFFQQLFERVGSQPGVQAVGGIDHLPLTGVGNNNGLLVDGMELPPDSLPPVVKTRYVAPGYFKTLSIDLLQGRTFEDRDNQARTTGAVISESLAREFWPNESALGKRVQPWGRRPDPGWFTVIGVVRDVRDLSLQTPGEKMIYYPLMGHSAEKSAPVHQLAVTIGSDLGADQIMPAVRSAVHDLEPGATISRVRDIRELVSHSMVRTTFTLILLGLASAVALLLGSVGIYGVIAYLVGQRAREIGVRMALGADRRRVLLLVLRQALLLAGAGTAVGLAASLALSRFISGLLFETSGFDPGTYLMMILVLTFTCLFGAYIPARRAATIDPIAALRSE